MAMDKNKCQSHPFGLFKKTFKLKINGHQTVYKINENQ